MISITYPYFLCIHAWHIHFIINDIGTTASLIERAWPHGGVYITRIKKSKCPEEDFGRLAAYLTKDEKTREVKQDGTLAKPKIKEASYSHSRNMPLPDPKKKKLVRWQKDYECLVKEYLVAAGVMMDKWTEGREA